VVNSLLSRRDFTKIIGAGAIIGGIAGLYAINNIGFPRIAYNYSKFDPRNPTNFSYPLRTPKSSGVLGIINSPSSLEMNVVADSIDVIGATPTNILGYKTEHNGEVYINPTIILKKDENFNPTLINKIQQETIIHWHGLHLDWKNDGHPVYAAGPSESYNYNFKVPNRAGTYWYHPHPMGITAQQVYGGLAGFFIVDDNEEEELRRLLDLEFGTTDIPIVLQDRRFNQQGQLVYNPNHMEQFMGFLGDTILANLTPNPYIDVDTRVYRFRILNGSNARIYRLAFIKNNQKIPFHLIGTDGGLLERSFRMSEVFVGPGERIDILVDLRKLSAGDTIFLKNLGFISSDMMGHMGRGMNGGGMMGGGMMGDTMSGSTLDEGEDFFVLKLVVKNKIDYDVQIPEELSKIERFDISDVKSRRITISGSMMGGMGMMGWLINGYSYDLYSYPIQVSRDSSEVWEIYNMGMGNMGMSHPMHIHGFSFQVLGRLGSPSQVRRYAIDDKGRLPTDSGWKDTVLVWPGEKVVIALDFSLKYPDEQIYLFHCHNLEHHDGGMMVNYKII
jgi:blue copper oxidase